jgi:hypothetical protein
MGPEGLGTVPAWPARGPASPSCNARIKLEIRPLSVKPWKALRRFP